MSSMNESAVGIKGQEIVDQAYELLEIVESAYRQGTAAYVVERGLFQKLLKMGYQALGYFFELYGACDEGEGVELSDGRRVKRLRVEEAPALSRRFTLPVSAVSGCVPV